ncbi:MAG: PrsW family intramembrane metalloprotease [Patescibacteria group bacterium]|nr:PrsW family intramembrane metalloprotease [Patescibacteria group bacterium]
MNLASLGFLYLFVVISPIVFWIWFFRRLDATESESGRFLFRIFRFGFVALVIAFIVEIIIDRTFFSQAIEFMGTYEDVEIDPTVLGLILISFFLAGPVEEFIKYYILRRVTFKNPEFNQIADGIIYGVTLALGFVLVENTGYFYDLYANAPEDFLFSVSLFRGTATTLLHIVSTGIIGLYLGRSKFETGGGLKLALKGVLIASLLHGMFNVFLFFEFGFFMNILLVIIAMIYLVLEIRRGDFQKVWVVAKKESTKMEE